MQQWKQVSFLMALPRRELILTHTDGFNNSPGFTVSQDIGSESQEAKDTGW